MVRSMMLITGLAAIVIGVSVGISTNQGPAHSAVALAEKRQVNFLQELERIKGGQELRVLQGYEPRPGDVTGAIVRYCVEVKPGVPMYYQCGLAQNPGPDERALNKDKAIGYSAGVTAFILGVATTAASLVTPAKKQA